jgi:hypothetical protein
MALSINGGRMSTILGSCAVFYSKQFFFEKKNQKTFTDSEPRGAPCITRARHKWKKFLLLFSKRSPSLLQPDKILTTT